MNNAVAVMRDSLEVILTLICMASYQCQNYPDSSYYEVDRVRYDEDC